MAETNQDAPTRLPTENVVRLLGELNKEAQAATYLAVPDEGLTPMNVVTDNLALAGAFELVTRKRFNARGMVSNTNPALISVYRDPRITPRHDLWSSIWVKKASAPVGSLANGTAGLLLDFSARHSRPIRTIIGEKKEMTNGNSATLNRLGVLAVLAQTTQNGDHIDPPAVFDQLNEQFDIQKFRSKRHLQSLINAGILRPINAGSQQLEFATRPDGKEVAEEIWDFLGIVKAIATVDWPKLEEGHQRGLEIIKNPRVLPFLIQRSFMSSGHTGKSSPRKSK